MLHQHFNAGTRGTTQRQAERETGNGKREAGNGKREIRSGKHSGKALIVK